MSATNYFRVSRLVEDGKTGAGNHGGRGCRTVVVDVFPFAAGGEYQAFAAANDCARANDGRLALYNRIPFAGPWRGIALVGVSGS